MPNKHAAIKDLRKNRKRAIANARIKTNIKALFKQSKELAAAGKTTEAKETARKYQQAADKAAKRGIIHKNQAARRKSSVMRKAK